MATPLILLHAADIPAALTLATQHADLVVLVFDPGLVDRAVAAGLPRVHCMQWDDAPPHLERADEATRLSRTLGDTLDALVEPVWPGLALGSWQQLSLFYLHSSLLWYSGLAASVCHRLPEGRVHIPFTDNPQTYYFPSFVPALLLLQQLQREGRVYQAFTHGSKPLPTQPVPALHGVRTPGGRPYLLTHLPTCFYDAEHINRELAHSGHTVVDLTARYWHVPIGTAPSVPTAEADAMFDTLPADQQARITDVLQRLQAPLDAHLARWLQAAGFRARQLAQLLAAYRAQLVTLCLLQQHFARQAPLRLLVSDHDTDFHGPLSAYARAQQVPMLVLPHSKTSTDLDFVARDATVLCHAIQGDPVYDVRGHRPLQATLALPAQLNLSAAVGPVRRVGLLLNGISLNGIPNVEFADYRTGLLRIVAWCRDQGLELVLRSRAARTLFRPVLERSGLSGPQLAASVEGTMAEFAESCDLCLMYDAPTSGAVEFLNRGVPLLNPVVSTQSKRETASMHTRIVPRTGVEVALRQAATLVADPAELQCFRMQQLQAYLAHLAQARALREFL